ncbi:MAG: TnsA endonuclease N-terminal domain-containing protein [Clostridiales bacterium]|nr:TnsA endonuclease N-terminal domain-containing protein [Clostridiales bacterium]
MNRGKRYQSKRKRKQAPGSKFKTGIYIPVNENKYRAPTDTTMNNNKLGPTYRSSWEKFYCELLDHSDKVEYWGVEILCIPYFDTEKNKMRRYFPDFFIKLKDGTKLVHEVKPKKQTQLQNNLDKWQAAEEYCKKTGAIFQVITEIELKKFGMKI